MWANQIPKCVINSDTPHTHPQRTDQRMSTLTRTHECTLGHLMAGRLDDGIFYCAHGVPLGTPDPQQPQPNPAIVGHLQHAGLQQLTTYKSAE